MSCACKIDDPDKWMQYWANAILKSSLLGYEELLSKYLEFKQWQKAANSAPWKTELHRIPGVLRTQARAYREMSREVTKLEKAALELLNLPSIAKVRRATLQEPKSKEGKFTFSFEQKQQYGKLIEDFGIWAIGAEGSTLKESPAIAERSWLVRMILRAFEAGQLWARNLIKRKLPPGIDMNNFIMADPDSFYLKGMIAEAAKRIKTELALSNIQQVYAYLAQSAEAGAYPLDVAKELHKMIGEGKLWYWERIARSESALAANAAFDAAGQQNGILYEEWSAASNACNLCASLDGQCWEFGSGPKPVDDSHPNCGCARVPLYKPSRQVSPPYSAPSPYKD